MQTVLSRAAQARCLCNCSTCVSITAATARRTTAVTARRGIRRGDVFTVFASSLAASAAWADSRKKDARSAQWERAIAEVRAQVEATEQEQQSRLESLAQGIESETVERIKAIKKNRHEEITQCLQSSWRQIRPYSHVDSWAEVFHWAAQQDVVRATAGFEDWKGPSLSLLQSLTPGQLQKLLRDDKLLRRFYGGASCAAFVESKSNSDLSAKKIKTLEWSVAKLVLKLLIYSSGSVQQEETGFEVPLQDLSRVPEEISSHVPTGHIDTEPVGDIEANDATPNGKSIAERNYLPDSCRQNQQPQYMVQGQSLEERLSQIDQHLFLLLIGGHEHITNADSSYFRNYQSPPLPKFCNNSANELDEAFPLHQKVKRLLDPVKCKDELETVFSKVGYYLLTSETPPNVHTYNLLLVRLCYLGNYKMFRAVLTSMRESHIRPDELTHSTVLRYFTNINRGDFFLEYVLRMEGHMQGLALANPNTEISPIVSTKYHVFHTGGGKEKVALKARMNGEVYEALIAGALRFLGPQSAMQYYRDMINEGWKASVDLLTAILKSCYGRCDWDSGVSVWHQIIAISDQVNSKAFEWMLCLCQACGRLEVFEQILREGVTLGVLPSSMLQLSDRVKCRSRQALSDDRNVSENCTVDQTVTDPAPVSWIEKHFANSMAAHEMIDTQDKLPVRTEYSNPIRRSWVEKYGSNEVVKKECSDVCLPGVEEEKREVTRIIWSKSSMLPKRTIKDIPRLAALIPLAGKVAELNKQDPQKMVRREEYYQFRNPLPRKLRNCGQIISRSFFEKYKGGMDSQLEDEDREGRLFHERSAFTALKLGDCIATPGSLSSDDEYISCLVSEPESLSSNNKNMSYLEHRKAVASQGVGIYTPSFLQREDMVASEPSKHGSPSLPSSSVDDSASQLQNHTSPTTLSKYFPRSSDMHRDDKMKSHSTKGNARRAMWKRAPRPLSWTELDGGPLEHFEIRQIRPSDISPRVDV